MIKQILEKVTEKKVYVVMLLIFLVSLIPIIALATYNFPCGDDFSASDDLRLAWMNTGSIIAVLKAAWDNVVFNYLEWSGVYMSVFWTSLQPGLFGEHFYCITTYITLILFWVSVYYFIHVVFSKYFPTDKYVAQSIGILYLFTIIQCMPSGNEGLFWHAGTANYSWAFSFLLILSGLMLSIYKEERKQYKILKCILACIFAVFVGGGNYITALQGTVWLITMLVVICLTEKITGKKNIMDTAKKNWANILPAVVIVAAFAASILAPGNEERMLESYGMGALKAIFVSFYYCMDMVIKEWISWPVVMLLALAVPFMWQMTGQQKFQFKYPGIVAVFAYAFSSAAFTPLLYAQGNVYAERVQNTIFMIVIFMLYSLEFYIIGWIRQRVEVKEKENETGKKIYIIGLSVFFLFVSAISIKASEDTFIASEAFFDIVSGQAESFKQQNEKRLVLYLDETLKNVVVERFVDPPELLQFEDNTPDPTEWINLVVAKYYEKESVRSEEY